MSAPEVTSHRLGPVAAIPLGEGRAYVVDGVQISRCFPAPQRVCGTWTCR